MKEVVEDVRRGLEPRARVDEQEAKVLVDELCMEVYNVSAAGVYEIFSNISMMDFQDEVHHKCQMSIELDDQDKFCWIDGVDLD